MFPLTGEPPVTSWPMESIFVITFALYSPTPTFWLSLMQIVVFCKNLSTSEEVGAKTAPSTLLTAFNLTITSTAGGMSVVTSLHNKEESKTKIILVITVYAILLSGAAPRSPPQLSTGLAPLNEHN